MRREAIGTAMLSEKSSKSLKAPKWLVLNQVADLKFFLKKLVKFKPLRLVKYVSKKISIDGLMDPQ